VITARELRAHFGPRRNPDRRIGRSVCPPRDTAQDIRDRLARMKAGEVGRAARERAFPVLTAENADAAIAFQEQAISAEYARLMAEANA
jgi:hypothetical protein